MTQHLASFVFKERLKALRPTQFAVGYAEVEEKRKEWGELTKAQREEFYASMVIPVVIGPEKICYSIDHHHEGRALLMARQIEVLVHSVADLHYLKPGEFWAFMVTNGWCYLFDHKGKPRPYAELPASLMELTDDPYRSLAGFLRKAGGYAKSTAPFAEFKWAQYLRRRVADPTDLEAALKIASQKEADFLPGWVTARAA